MNNFMRQHTDRRTLINIHSKVYGCIRLPANFGNISEEELFEKYQAACMNIPRDLGPRPIRANNSTGRQGAERVAQFLNDQLVYLEALILEIHSLQEKLAAVLGGFHTDEINTYELAGFPTDISLPIRLNPVAAYYIRVLARFRLAQVDFSFVSESVETILEAFGRVYRGEHNPVMAMSRRDLDDLATQWRACESVYLAIDLEYFKLNNGAYENNTLFYKDQETVRQHQRLYGNPWAAPPTNCFGPL
ncbi:hypothetical protein KVR01_000004 [Diaporthe batatas]|uniref:uncharacterized protein n=1 Tax=Diaporthe batatas TaxID=748121 RepID=UPI001D050C2B|nr:uncharacterized protein KVR01_000004 [Diaporthe batatas]KAG8169259.1 hypothetical protein KVR01_000004 [Diaporthe batatas]